MFIKWFQRGSVSDALGQDSLGVTTLRGAASWLMVLCVILNNLSYQTDFQINQYLFSLSALLFITLIACSHGRVSAFLPTLFLIIITIYALSVWFSETTEDFNRSVLYFVASLLFVSLLFSGYRVYVSASHFYIFTIFYFFIVAYIAFSGDRTIVNPNWVAVTFFYLFFLVWGRSSLPFLSVGLILSFFIFESRGSSVIFLVSILLFLSQHFLGERLTKKLYLLVYFSLIFCLFFIIHLLSSENELLAQLIFSMTERGLGGREAALIHAYQDLIESKFLGVGPASPGAYVDPITGRGVHIHFGLLELMLKYSGVIVFGFSYLMMKLVRNSSVDQFPMVGGAMMAVFFYNGLAPSHFGLNILLLLIISRVIRKPNGMVSNKPRKFQNGSERFSLQ